MNKLIIDLNTNAHEKKGRASVKMAFLWNPVFSSGVGILVLLGFFTFIFGSTLFLVEQTSGGVFAHKGEKNVASLGGVLPGVEEHLDPVEVILYKDPFEFIEIEGEAAYVFDIVTGEVLYEKNKNMILPLASVTKVMTALTARDIMDEDDVVVIRPEDLSYEGSSGFVTGEEWRFEDLLNFTLMTSSNDGASAIAAAAGAAYRVRSVSGVDVSAKEIFVEKMNEKAGEIGMMNSIYNNETGLDITDHASGGHGTAHDMALLYEYILQTYPDLLGATRRTHFDIVSLDNILHTAENTNQNVAAFSGIIGSKTGYTDLAGGNLAVVFDSGLATPIVVVVLGSSVEGRFEDVAILSEAAREAVSQSHF